MSRSRKKSGASNVLGPIILVLVGLVVLITLLLQGHNVALANPKGLIAGEQFKLMVLTVGIMLVIGISALAALYFVAWRYRESNAKVKRDANAGHSKLLNVGMWLVPGAFAVVLASIMVPATYRLEPQKQIAANAENMTIQVIALRWKWLFIYPEQNIATVNYVQVPTGTPVTFELTADEAPFSSIWIPNWGGMMHVMSGGHINRLNLLADTPGEYPGLSAEINGAGFAGMKFIASATSQQDFDAWVREVSLTSDELSDTEYERLLEPSENNPQAFYSLTNGDLYAKVLMKYAGGSHSRHTEMESEPAIQDMEQMGH
jgi:cytochrome o ubiquinol oxidase subunit 2